MLVPLGFKCLYLLSHLAGPLASDFIKIFSWCELSVFYEDVIFQDFLLESSFLSTFKKMMGLKAKYDTTQLLCIFSDVCSPQIGHWSLILPKSSLVNLLKLPK